MSNCYKFDLDIHTPASSCYRGAKNDSDSLTAMNLPADWKTHLNV